MMWGLLLIRAQGCCSSAGWAGGLTHLGLRCVCVLLLALLICTGCLPLSRHGESSVLSGQVLNERGLPVSGAELTFRERQQGLKRIVGAGSDGAFELAWWLDADGQRQAISRGQHIDVLVYKPGYRVRTLQLEVPGGQLRLGELILQEESSGLMSDELEDRDHPTSAEEAPGVGGRSGRGE